MNVISWSLLVTLECRSVPPDTTATGATSRGRSDPILTPGEPGKAGRLCQGFSFDMRVGILTPQISRKTQFAPPPRRILAEESDILKIRYSSANGL